MIPTPDDLVVRTIERDTPATITITPEPLGLARDSRKRPNPPIFTDGVDLTFES